MAILQVDVVSVDEPFWQGEALSVTLKTVEGEIGLLPGHEPILGQLAEDGSVTIKLTTEELKYLAICGGFFSIDMNHVIILAEDAIWVDDIDIGKEEADLQNISPKSFEYARAQGRIKTYHRANG